MNLILTQPPQQTTQKYLIKKETCSDGMSEKSYPYSIEIKKDNRTLYGCGWQK